jgi:hypothetical protein
MRSSQTLRVEKTPLILIQPRKLLIKERTRGRWNKDKCNKIKGKKKKSKKLIINRRQSMVKRQRLKKQSLMLWAVALEEVQISKKEELTNMVLSLKI